MPTPPAEALVARMFWDSVQAHPQATAQQWHDGKGWASRSYQAFGEAVREVAYGLWALGLTKGDRVGLWSKNCPEWGEVDFGCLVAGLATVPVYDTLTGEKGVQIVNHAEAKVLFVQDAAILGRVLESPLRLSTVKHIVVLQGPALSAPPSGITVTSMAQLRASGNQAAAKAPKRLAESLAGLTASDLASLVYTSGTTADPKGAMLTQGNFGSNAKAAIGCVVIGPTDVFLSFLPLSHVFERTGGHFAPYAVGAKVVFARSVDTLMDDMQAAKPTLMMAVPRLYEKMYARIQDTVAAGSAVKRFLFRRALAVGMESNVYLTSGTAMPPSLARRHRRYDHLVARKLREKVGGRLRYFVSGGAALSRDIEAFFWAMGIPILQGYGLTETSPVTNVNRPGHIRFGSVGKAMTGVQVKLDTTDWPVTGKPLVEGEICVKGPNVMSGYWKNPKATKEVIDADGWFHTGDIGCIDADGFLFITDRKKEIIVMSNGKKVAPQAIEGALALQPHIAQAMVVGDDRSYITALLVPDWPNLEKFCLQNGIATTDRDRLVSDPRVVSLIEAQVEAVNARLSRFEQVKKFWVVPREWSVEGGELTPSLKLKRRIIVERFRDTIAKLYPTSEAATAP